MQNSNKLLNKLSYPYLIWLLIFIVFPLILVFWYSITPLQAGTGVVHYTIRFTLENYKKFISSSQYLVSFVNSFKLAFVATVFTLLLGYPIALILANLKGKIRNILLLLLIIPMWTNMLLRTYAWQYLIDRNGIINTFINGVNQLLSLNLPKLDIMYSQQAVVLGMAYNYLPFMILPIFAVLVKLDKSLLHAAYDLGANKWKAFIKITLPLSVPGIISGITMVFLPAATSFIIPAYLGGGKEVLIGNVIELQFKGAANNPNFGSTLSIILMIVIFSFTGLLSSLSQDQEDKGESLW
jgi:spermidine/putrescine transport system permease protein